MWDKKTGGVKKGGELKDCTIFEEYLEVCRLLQAGNFQRKAVYCTSNTNDYCDPGATPHPDVAADCAAVGLTFTTVLTAFLHIGVVIGLLPTTGLTLPFVSYGRSNLVLTMLFTGILVNIGSSKERVIGSGATDPLSIAS